MADFLFLLASTAPPVPEPSGLSSILGWVTSFVLAVLGFVLRFAWKNEGRKEERQRLQGNVTIDGEVSTRERADYATRDDVAKLRDEINKDLDHVHSRLGAAFKAVNTMDGVVSQIDANVGRLLDLQLGLPPGTTARRTATKKNG